MEDCICEASGLKFHVVPNAIERVLKVGSIDPDTFDGGADLLAD